MTHIGVELRNNQLLEMFRQLNLVRAFEEKCAREFAAGAMPGFLYLSLGVV